MRLGGSNCFIAVCCYAPTNTATSEVKQAFYQELSALLRNLKNDYPTHYFYIAGDFNATIGDDDTRLGYGHCPSIDPPTGRLRSNENGSMLTSFCLRKKLTCMNIAKKQKVGNRDTYQCKRNSAGSAKDFLLTYGKESKQIQYVRACGTWRESWFTDHRPLLWRLDTKAESFRPVLSKSLRAVARAAQSSITPPFVNPPPSTPKPTPSTQSTVGTATGGKRKLGPSGFGVTKRQRQEVGANFCEGWLRAHEGKKFGSADELISAAKELQDEFALEPEPTVLYPQPRICRAMDFRRALSEDPRMKDPNVSSKTKRHIARREQKRQINIRNRAMLKTIVLDSREVGIASKQTIERLTNFEKSLKPEIRSSDLPRPSDSEFAAHLGERFSRNKASIRATLKKHKYSERIGKALPQVKKLGKPPTLKEVKRAIRELTTGTAAGISGLRSETLKLSGDDFAEAVLAVITAYWCKEHGGQSVEIPDSLIRAKVFMIPKKGDLTDPKNWRSIFTLETLGKILARLVVNRIEPLVDAALGDTQFGFRKQMSTTQAIVALTLCQQKANEQEVEMWGLFIDIEMAFDSPS